MHEALAESAHASRREVSRVWLQREARRLWFDAVTSNGAQYEDDDSDSDDIMPDLPMPEERRTMTTYPIWSWFFLKTKSSLLPLE